MSEETPKVEPEASAAEGTADQPEIDSEYINEFVDQLEKANVKTPQQLEGHLTNARDYHKMQGENDRLSNEIKVMSEKMDKLGKAPAPKESWEDDTNQYAQPLNLEESLVGALQKYDSIKQEQSMKQQQQQLEAYDAIINDPSYGSVKDVWEQQLKDPRFMAEINSGRRHPVDAYKDIVINTQKKMLQKTSDILKELHGNKGVVTPHVEQGVKGGGSNEPTTKESAELFSNVKADVDKGRVLTLEEEMTMLDSTLSGK
jgi:hypothetical protein